MIRNFLTTAFRAALRRKSFTIFNILGLSIGFTVSLLILEYVKDELSYDGFIENKEDIYRIQYDRYRDGQLVFKSATTFPKVAPTLKSDYPEVENSCRVYMMYGGGVIRYNEKTIKENNVFLADQSFLEMFSYPMISGDRSTALSQPNTGLIEETIAQKYFGSDNPVGKRMHFRNNLEFEITGVIRSPENSHLKFSFLISYTTYPEFPGVTDGARRNQWEEAWGWYDFYNYIQLKPGADPLLLQSKLPDYVKKYGRTGDDKTTVFSLQPLKNIHLYSNLIQEARVNGDGRTVYLLLIISLFVLVIAWVNYVNLATAQATERSKEVGVRKSIGASRTSLAAQFIGEACLINLIALTTAVILLYLAIPIFNQLTDKQLTGAILGNPTFWYAASGLLLLGSILSGIYPALILSSFEPAQVLKGSGNRSRSGMLLRKGLVIIQFVASAALIAGTIVVYRQLSYMENQDLGIDVDRMLVINGPDVVANDSIYTALFTSFKNELQKINSIKKMTGTSEIPGNLVFSTRSAKRIGLDQEPTAVVMYRIHADHDLFDVFDNKLIAGRGFSRQFSDDRRNVVLNRKAVSDLGFESPDDALGRLVNIGRDTLTVAGVIENYHQEGLKVEFRPMSFHLDQSPQEYFVAKIEKNNFDRTLDEVRDTYQRFFPGNPFDYFLLDSFFQQQYRNDRQFGKIFSLFSLLAIFVASMGLFGLASFATSQRTKEIGIRKVLGSTVISIFVLISKDFLKLVAISNVIAIPLVWILMDRWLDTFAFRIRITLWIFAVSAAITVIVALLTVSYQSFKAAIVSPVKALRSE